MKCQICDLLNPACVPIVLLEMVAVYLDTLPCGEREVLLVISTYTMKNYLS